MPRRTFKEVTSIKPHLKFAKINTKAIMGGKATWAFYKSSMKGAVINAFLTSDDHPDPLMLKRYLTGSKMPNGQVVKLADIIKYRRFLKLTSYPQLLLKSTQISLYFLIDRIPLNNAEESNKVALLLKGLVGGAYYIAQCIGTHPVAALGDLAENGIKKAGAPNSIFSKVKRKIQNRSKRRPTTEEENIVGNNPPAQNNSLTVVQAALTNIPPSNSEIRDRNSAPDSCLKFHNAPKDLLLNLTMKTNVPRHEEVADTSSLRIHWM